MQSERWQSCTEIFHAALERAPNERTSFLAASCAGDDALRQKVELLLRYHEEAGDFIASPAFADAPELLAEDPDALIGEHLGCYRIDAVLGVGGMGVVYLAFDERLGRKVGLKLLPRALVTDEAQLERLKFEARTASALNHPNIVTVHEIGQIDFTHYIAIEFIEGTTLRERIVRGIVPPAEALEIAIQVASALCVAHRAGIVHRDIKPENIMIRPDGYVKVLDFGIAKSTQGEAVGGGSLSGWEMNTRLGVILGTMRYMSPEQARAETVDARSDIWSLGVVLYEMLAGAAPFDGKTPADVGAAVLQHEPPPLEHGGGVVSLALQGIVDKCLRKDPSERFQTSEEMLAELRVNKQLAQKRGPTEAALAMSITQRAARRSLLLRGASVALVVGAIAGALSLFGPFGARKQATSPNETAEKSIAVLPFVDLSQAKDQEYFCDGMSEELLDSLSRIEGLRVVARTSSFSFKGKALAVADIAQKLGVQNILEGSLRRDGNRIRITAQLINARDGFHLWSETFERELQGVFAVQDEITSAIVEKLRAKMALAPSRRVSENAEAHELYLRGLYFSNKTSEEELRKALALFQQALEKDPNFAHAWTGIAKVWLWLADEYVTPLEGYAAMEAAASKALALNPNDTEARCHLGEARWFLNWDPASAEAESARALAIDPNSASAHLLLALLQPDRGDCAAGTHIRAAEELDPLSPVITNRKKSLMIRCHRIDEALAAAQRTIELDPNFLYRESSLAVVYREQGKLDQALALYLKAAEIRHRPSAGLAIVYADLGRETEAREVLRQLLERRKSRYMRADAIAGVYAALDEREETFAWLETAYREHSSSLPNVPFLSEFRPLLSDPRFADLMRRIGFDPDVILRQQKSS
jgi:eukaryotic-like serine/threonine-protein kinase